MNETHTTHHEHPRVFSWARPGVVGVYAKSFLLGPAWCSGKCYIVASLATRLVSHKLDLTLPLLLTLTLTVTVTLILTLTPTLPDPRRRLPVPPPPGSPVVGLSHSAPSNSTPKA